MISTKYKSIYDNFIRSYKEIHVNPWHEITEQELNGIVDKLLAEMDVDNIYSFKYFIDYIIKRLNGKDDAHTKFQAKYILPINFRLFDNEVYVNFPENLKCSKLLFINGVKIDKILEELENVITYGTEGKRKREIELALFDYLTLFGLPSLRKSESLVFTIIGTDGQIVNRTFNKEERYSRDELFDYEKFLYGDNAQFRIEDGCLIYNHSSVQTRFKDKIEKAINELRSLDLSSINKIIVDLRGNIGGNSSLNKLLIDFLREHEDKKIIVLIDYRVFSSGRFALRDLIDLGGVTIGEEIGTPMNCYGDCSWIDIDGLEFSISSCYFHPIYKIAIRSQEKFDSNMTPEILEPVIFKPDIYVESSVTDFINSSDTVLECAKTIDLDITLKGKK